MTQNNTLDPRLYAWNPSISTRQEKLKLTSPIACEILNASLHLKMSPWRSRFEVLLSFLLVSSCLCWGSAAITLDGSDYNEDPPSFGHDILHQEFLLNYTNFNHGSYGACPKSVLEYQNSLRLQQEQQPDPWMREKYLQLINETRREISDYVRADHADNLVLVESASTAVNAIMRSFQWQPGDIVLYFSVTYKMVQNTAHWLQRQEGIEIVEVPIYFPIHEEDALTAFTGPLQDTLQKLKDASKIGKLRLVVLDHIVSIPAVRVPVAECAEMVKSFQEGVFVLVDGAHAMGQIHNVNLSKLGPIDAYLSNGHKWLYSPKGSAFLWIHPAKVTDVFPEPTVIASSNQIGETCVSERFAYVSTRDYTAIISMKRALEFRQWIGGDDAIYAYNRNLARSAKIYLMSLWDVPAMAPESLEEFMINIALPLTDVATAKGLHAYLLSDHNMYAVIAFDTGSSFFYTRLSAQIYLEMSDFVRLGDAVLKYITNVEDTTPRMASLGL
jgi:selenocysteine lyase/cysteine desulfurase